MNYFREHRQTVTGGEIAACIKTTTGITGSNISYNASKDQVTVNGLNAKELRIYAS